MIQMLPFKCEILIKYIFIFKIVMETTVAVKGYNDRLFDSVTSGCVE